MRRVVSILLLIALVTASAWSEAQDKYSDPELTAKDRDHWAFKPRVKPHVPDAAGAAVRNPIDHFIFARLSREGLKPAPEADRLTLLRRVTLDLTGLPPTPAEVEAFSKDTAPDAYEKLVDRLLASPHFGERWAQHWLDVVRFAESNGYEVDADRPQAWRYRDYVIRSFNDDKPYDRFLTEQIAGDELAAGKDAAAAREVWIATGLHRCGPVHMVSGNLDADVLRQEKLTEMVNGVGSTFLGLTVGCARCHDHKFDPISAGDYYRLQAFFGSVQYVDVDFATPAEREARKKEADALDARIAPVKKRINELDAPYRTRIAEAKRAALEAKYKDVLAVPADKRDANQKKLAAEAAILTKVTWDEIVGALTPADRERRAQLREQLHDLESRLPPPSAAAWAIRVEKTAETFLLKRGDPHRKLGAVEPAVPRIAANGITKPKSRLDLARWLTSPENPLTARVIVNRLWHYHFGRGIVGTPNDFGTRGERPTHPELLDWLASELIERGWSLKAIHRLIVTSATYRQSATTDQGAKVDPDNRLLWRMNRRRLEAEAIRDSILTAAGTLNRELGGVSIKVPLEPEVYDLIFTEGEPDGLWNVTPDKAQHTRRSIYLFNKRNVRLPLFEAFDQPDSLNSCAFRPVSIFAPQALILMNAPFVREEGNAMAARLFVEAGGDVDRQIELVYRRAVGRKPNSDELALARAFLTEQEGTIRDRMRARQPIAIDAKSLPPGADPAQIRALGDLCVVVFNTHEFVHIP
jgi:uncharacterized protein DUF1553/uncharacterized protein DUF1549